MNCAYFFPIKNPFCFHRRDLSVGVAGFEPAASCSQSRRDNRATLHPEKNCKAEGQGLEPWHRLLDDSLANYWF